MKRKPKIKVMDNDKRLVLSFLEQGISSSEIVLKTGVSYNSVRYLKRKAEKIGSFDFENLVFQRHNYLNLNDVAKQLIYNEKMPRLGYDVGRVSRKEGKKYCIKFNILYEPELKEKDIKQNVLAHISRALKLADLEKKVSLDEIVVSIKEKKVEIRPKDSLSFNLYEFLEGYLERLSCESEWGSEERKISRQRKKSLI